MEGTGLGALRNDSRDGLYGSTGGATGCDVLSLEDDESLAPAGDWGFFGTAEGNASVDGFKGGLTLVELSALGPRTVRDAIFEKKFGILEY